jgi:hypothetical protein
MQNIYPFCYISFILDKILYFLGYFQNAILKYSAILACYSMYSVWRRATLKDIMPYFFIDYNNEIIFLQHLEKTHTHNPKIRGNTQLVACNIRIQQNSYEFVTFLNTYATLKI